MATPAADAPLADAGVAADPATPGLLVPGTEDADTLAGGDGNDT